MGNFYLYGFCGFSVCRPLNSVNRQLASTILICLLTGASPSRQWRWNCSWTVSIPQEQMRGAQNYKRRIAACNPIALLARDRHQKSIWGCLAAGNQLPPNGDAGASQLALSDSDCAENVDCSDESETLRRLRRSFWHLSNHRRTSTHLIFLFSR